MISSNRICTPQVSLGGSLRTNQILLQKYRQRISIWRIASLADRRKLLYRSLIAQFHSTARSMTRGPQGKQPLAGIAGFPTLSHL
jgi:hypothetical protein